MSINFFRYISKVFTIPEPY